MSIREPYDVSAAPAPSIAMRDLKGKVSIITGGATGIGLALALDLAKEGDAKIVIASTNRERLEAAAEKIRSAGAQCLPIVCDVSDKKAVQNLHDKAAKAFGLCDVLVLNAGVTTGGPLLDHREEDWDWVYGVVLFGVTNFIQIYYPEMCRRGAGHIVITGSQAGMNPTWFSNHGPYTSAKAAVMALGAALRLEAAEHGVGVTSVIVAATHTDIMQCERARPERFGAPQQVEREKRVARRIPASDVSGMIVRGIKENREWVATHPELKGMQKSYFDRILKSYDDIEAGTTTE